MRTIFRLLLAITLAAPAHAATLAEALRHWTGVTADVIGTGDRVRVVLPPGSPVPVLNMRAHPATRGAEQGWDLTDITIPVPARLADGAHANIAAQHATAWLGDRTADVTGAYDDVAIINRGATTRLDHARLAATAATGPVILTVDLTGLHTEPARTGAPPLLPQHLSLRGHTTADGLAALTAMFNGQPAAPAPVGIDTLSFDIGPASFAATGHVTLITPTNRTGQITLEATDFGALMRLIPTDTALVRLYPVMMILRQMAHKQNGRLVWTADLTGNQINVNGLDIAPLLGL